jgi:hypothetical protein
MLDYLENILDDFQPEEYLEGEFAKVARENEDFYAAVASLENPFSAPESMYELYFIRYILNELSELSRDLRNSISETRAGMTPRDWPRDQRSSYGVFFAFVGQSLESMLKDAFFYHIVSEKARIPEVRNKVRGVGSYWGISPTECREYLHNGNVIDDGLNGNIKQTWDLRCEAVHDLRHWFGIDLSPNDIESHISHSERAIVRLAEVTYGIDLEKPHH